MIASVRGRWPRCGWTARWSRSAASGYLVQATPGTLAALRVRARRPSWPPSMVVREDSLTLYGFADADERDVFEMVQTVSGVGPRLALAMLAVHTPDGAAPGRRRRGPHRADPGPGHRPQGRPAHRARAGRPARRRRCGRGRRRAGRLRVLARPTPTVVEALVGLGWPAKQADGRGPGRGGRRRRRRSARCCGPRCGTSGGADVSEPRDPLLPPTLVAYDDGSVEVEVPEQDLPTSAPGSWRPGADEMRAGRRGGAAAPAAGRSSSGSGWCASSSSLVLEAATARGGRPRPRAAVRPARAGQDDAGDDHRGRAGRRRCGSPAARRSSTRATSPPSCPRWRRARCCSSTRSTAWPGPPRRCCTSRWRTSGSTSSSARAPARPRSRWSCRRSPSSAPPPAPACCRPRCATGSASPATSTTTPPRSWSACCCAPPGCSASTSSTGRGREIAGRSRGTPADRQPAAAPRARLGAGARRRHRRPARRPGRAGGVRGRRHRPRPARPRRAPRAVQRFGGGPVGLTTLAVAVGEEPETVETVAEPFLVREGLVGRTPRGRGRHRGLARAPRAAGAPDRPTRPPPRRSCRWRTIPRRRADPARPRCPVSRASPTLPGGCGTRQGVRAVAMPSGSHARSRRHDAAAATAGCGQDRDTAMDATSLLLPLIILAAPAAADPPASASSSASSWPSRTGSPSARR